ncbi:MAG: nuclear transport factor 2 family protein [Betaproteobacteria bacterium]|nr:nuclear transport factor 2 family protein [Betaproteobacteria bacterium]
MDATVLEELARRLQRVEDRQQISELISRYCVSVDDADFDSLAKLFLEDSQFNVHRGRAAIMANYRARTDARGPSYHYAHSHYVDFESETAATGVVNGHVELAEQGKTVLIGLRYMDRYTKSGGRWYFQSRQAKFRYVLPFDEMATSYGDEMRVRWPGRPAKAADLPDKLETYLRHRQAPPAA